MFFICFSKTGLKYVFVAKGNIKINLTELDNIKKICYIFFLFFKFTK